MKRAVIFLLMPIVIFCSSCTPKEGGRKEASEASIAWQRFTARAQAAETTTGPFRVSGTLRYTDKEGQSTRVSSLFWGNASADSPYPLRLDLIAGAGNVVAKIREDQTSFLAYVPDENIAYTQRISQHTLLAFGVPIPFTLSDLSLFLTGRSGALLLPAASNNPAMPSEYTLTEHGAAFLIHDALLPGRLEVSFSGAPLSWQEAKEGGWRIEFEPRENNPLLLRRLRMSHPDGYSAIIVVRDLERLTKSYSHEQLSLRLPPNAKVHYLREQ